MEEGVEKGVDEGVEVTPLKVEFTGDKLARYCRLVREVNPLHFDEEYAKRAGFKGIVVQGVFTFSYMVKMLCDWAGGYRSVKRLAVRFMAPVYVGDTVTFHGRVTKRDHQGGNVECHVWATNQEGEKVMEGEAVVKIDGDGDRNMQRCIRNI